MFRKILLVVSVGLVSGCSLVSDDLRADSVRIASRALMKNDCKTALKLVNTAKKFGKPSTYEKKEIENIQYKCSSQYVIDQKNKTRRTEKKRKIDVKMNHLSQIIWNTNDFNVAMEKIGINRMTSADQALLVKHQLSIIKMMHESYSYSSGEEASIRNYLKKLLTRITSQEAQLLAVSADGEYYEFIKNPSRTIYNHPNVISYKKEKIAELKRKKEIAEYAKYSGSSSSNSSSGSNSYSAPQQRTCTRTVYHTEYAPGNSGRTVQIPRSESYPCN